MLLSFLLSLGATAQAARILVFGDSISAAYGLEVSEGWVALLDKKLQKEFPKKHSVINLSVSGETTSGGLARLPAALKRHQPDVVLIELGGNDALRGQSIKMIQANLSKMVSLSKAAGAKVLILGMKIPPNYGGAYTRAFEGTFVTASKEHNVPLVPFFLDGVGGIDRLMQADGVHPTAEAQPILLNNAWQPLLNVLKP